MSTEESVDPELIEQTKQQIRSLVREIAQIAKTDIAPQEFYDAVLNRVVTALAAVGGAIWTVNEAGQLALEYQINLRETRLAESEENQIKHGRLLRKVIDSGEGTLIGPQSGSGNEEDGANPTDYLLVMGPLKTARETAGVMEIFQRPGRNVTVQRGYLRFLLQMCELASEYLKSRKLQHFTDRQALWAQLEQFTRLVHQGLNPRETAYTIANEGRRLIECDRVSVATCQGRKTKIVAISGQDTFDKRSNTVTLLTHLAKAVVATGETVWYTGDTSNMAPQVEEAVQSYVDEVHSKAVAIVPLKEPHDENDPLARPKVVGALIIEQIEDSRPREGLPQRIEIVSNHSALALTNVQEHNDLFLMPVWRTIGKSRWLVEARQLPWTATACIALLAVLLFLFLWPANFELSADGKLRPTVRQHVFAALDGDDVSEVFVEHGQMVKKGDPLLQMENSTLERQIAEAQGNLAEAIDQRRGIKAQLEKKGGLESSEEFQLIGRERGLEKQIISTRSQLQLLQKQRERLLVTSPIDGEVITWKPREMLINRPVKTGQLLLTVVKPDGEWELELHMSEDDMGYVAEAQAEFGPELPVDYVLLMRPGVTHSGTVREVHHTAEVRGEEGNTVLVEVAIDKNDLKVRQDGAVVKAQVYCGRSSIGYAWFHDLISFVQEKWFQFF
ncbi:MAG: biotin/lipoyl-binding protein [Planctomycetota bacterium]|nr:MAG: biotin/lipoyl-binding protein [Planctomycetota bacterium]